MSKNRPNITVKPNIANDVIALLNAQQGWDAVPVGTALFIQNKGSVPIFVHETAGEPTSFDGGIGIYYTGWGIETDADAPGVKITFKGTSDITVGVKVI
ncbi:hypothetical protein ABZP26_02010 [Pseudoalteromonas sp. SD03]|uniref:Uncharacterized protein n=1 Tax=Pseudoalteromonas sp. SD03 TaxID=3231719 RepID=A0AB39ARR5_9GAMM